MRNFKAHVETQLNPLAPAADIVAELAQELEQRYGALIRDGASDGDAWREANAQMEWPRLARELSISLPRAPEPSGGAGVGSGIFRDARYAPRQFTRDPGFAITAILILAVAIGAATAIFSVFDALVLHPLPYAAPEQLVGITEDFKKLDITGMQLAAVELDDLRAMTKSFSHLAGIRSAEFTLTSGGAAEAVPGLQVSAGIFAMLAVRPILGAPFKSEEEEYGNHRVAVLSENLWRRRFGSDPNIVGTSIEINREAYRVAAVVRPFLDYRRTAWELWAPLSFRPQDKTPASRGVKSVDVVGRVKSGVTIASAEQELATVGSRLGELHPGPRDLGFSLRLSRFADTIAGDLRRPLLFMLAAVGVLTLIACANVSNLLMVRASARRKEMSIRAALGAARTRLAGQLMIESIALAGVSGTVGVALAVVLLKVLVVYGPANLIPVAGVGLNGWVVAFAIALSFGASVLFGLAPAFAGSSDLNDALRKSGRGATSSRRRFRAAMVALEVAASLVLLVCAGLLIRSFLRLEQVDPGFSARNVLTFELLLPVSDFAEPSARIAFYDAFRSRLQALPGVVSAGAANRIPFGGIQRAGTFRVAGRSADPSAPQALVQVSEILPGYFESMGIPLFRGRHFTPEDRMGSAPVVIIDRATALRFFPDGEEPLGKQINDSGSLTATIVGVVGSVEKADLSSAPEMSVYLPATQNAGTRMTFTVKTVADPLEMIPSIRHELAELVLYLPLTRILTLEQRLSDSLARRRLSTQLMLIFGLLALALAATGLYGVLSYVVHQRRREVGIRVALGARPAEVIELVAKQGLLPVALGIACGLAGAMAAARLLTSVLYQVSPHDPLVYALVTGVLLVVAIAAIAVPARRAATIDPVIALREE